MFHTVHNRIVATYQPGTWPEGVLTGRDDLKGGFALEHVIVWHNAAPTVLRDMLRAGIEEAWNMGFRYITWHVPHAFPASLALAEVGRRLGFEKVAQDAANSYFMLTREMPVPA